MQIALILIIISCQRSDIDHLIDAIGIVESQNNDNAVGDGGRAIGRYQIHKAYWIDGTKELGVNWPYSDAGNPRKARAVVKGYFRRYGKGFTIEQLARLHKGGCNLWDTPATDIYWEKVKKIFENIKKSS